MDAPQHVKDPKKLVSRLPDVLRRHEADLLRDWIRRQLEASSRRSDLLSEDDLRDQSQRLLRAIQIATQTGALENIHGQAWEAVRDLLNNISTGRASQGFSPSETATFVLSLKEPLFARLRAEFAHDPQILIEEIWSATMLVDQLGLFTADCFLRLREQVIRRQQQDMLELSTPVVELWKDILALPLIGTLDSARGQVVMESLLQRIVERSARIAILDITGVPTVDTLVAQHLLKTVAAARLMGADCVISGIRPQIAQTIVHLGVDLSNVTTKATMAEALATALQRTGQRISSTAPSPGSVKPA